MEQPTNYLVHVYALYAVASVGLTVWLARTLARNGAVFLEDVFPGQPRLGEAVNHLLVVGFYLVNLGYAAMLLRAYDATTPVHAIEILAEKMGALLLSLAFMHFVNLYVFHRIRRRARLDQLPPPVAAQLPVTAG